MAEGVWSTGMSLPDDVAIAQTTSAPHDRHGDTFTCQTFLARAIATTARVSYCSRSSVSSV